MTPTSNNSKRNLILILGIVFAFLLLLVIRLGWIQIVKGSTYSEKAVEQQTRDTPIEAERGTIYDRNGNELAVSVTCYTIWVRPVDVKKTEEKDAVKQKAEIEKKTKEVSKTLSETLDMDYDEVYKMVTKEQSIVKVKKGVSKDVADKIRKADLSGVEIAEDTKRDYPLGAFASQTLGTVTDDNTGRVRPGAAVQYLPEWCGWKVDQLYGYQRKPPVLRQRKILQGRRWLQSGDDHRSGDPALYGKGPGSGHGGYQRGSRTAIVMDPKTGDILAWRRRRILT